VDRISRRRIGLGRATLGPRVIQRQLRRKAFTPISRRPLQPGYPLASPALIWLKPARSTGLISAPSEAAPEITAAADSTQTPASDTHPQFTLADVRRALANAPSSPDNAPKPARASAASPSTPSSPPVTSAPSVQRSPATPGPASPVPRAPTRREAPVRSSVQEVPARLETGGEPATPDAPASSPIQAEVSITEAPAHPVPNQAEAFTPPEPATPQAPPMIQRQAEARLRATPASDDVTRPADIPQPTAPPATTVIEAAQPPSALPAPTAPTVMRQATGETPATLSRPPLEVALGLSAPEPAADSVEASQPLPPASQVPTPDVPARPLVQPPTESATHLEMSTPEGASSPGHRLAPQAPTQPPAPAIVMRQAEEPESPATVAPQEDDESATKALPLEAALGLSPTPTQTAPLMRQMDTPPIPEKSSSVTPIIQRESRTVTESSASNIEALEPSAPLPAEVSQTASVQRSEAESAPPAASDSEPTSTESAPDGVPAEPPLSSVLKPIALTRPNLLQRAVEPGTPSPLAPRTPALLESPAPPPHESTPVKSTAPSISAGPALSSSVVLPTVPTPPSSTAQRVDQPTAEAAFAPEGVPPLTGARPARAEAPQAQVQIQRQPQLPALPIVQRETEFVPPTTSPPEVPPAPSTEAAQTGAAPSAPTVDLETMAQQVYQILRRRLRVEQERMHGWNG